MPSSRRLPAAYNTSSYDSAGGRDYSTLALWEAATDNDLVAAGAGEVLECYRGAHDDAADLAIAGAVTNQDFFRVIRPAPGHGHQGIPLSDGSCVEFHGSLLSQYKFLVGENFSQLHDLVIRADPATDSQAYLVRMGATETGLVGCLLYDSVNNGSSSINGVIAWLDAAGTCYIVNCLVHNIERDGIATWNGTVHVYNSTITENGRYGMYQFFGAGVAKNCAVSGNATGDWQGTWTVESSTPEGALPSYTDATGDDFSLLATDIVCRDLGADLVNDGLYPFDDDILGQIRSDPWDIGFHEVLFVPDVFSGKISVSLSARAPGLSLASRTSGMTFTARAPGITFRLNDD